jgi:hypothetical protein
MLMKKIAISLSVAAMIAFAACADNEDKGEGNDQVQDPVMNSGPETEGDRARDAVKDSAAAGSDSTIRRDADAPSTPH